MGETSLSVAFRRGHSVFTTTYYWLFLALLHCVFVEPGFAKSSAKNTKPALAVRLLPVEEHPSFVDDFVFEGMDLAIERQVQKIENLSPSAQQRTFTFGKETYSLSHIAKSLRKFQVLYYKYYRCLSQAESVTEGSEISLIEKQKGLCQKDFDKNISQQFRVYVPNLQPGDRGYGSRALFTAYNSPQIKASYAKTQQFRYPVYMRPVSRHLRRLTRKEIDFENKLSNEHILFYTDNMFELYFLQIQGGGVAQFESTGERQYLHYNGTNGRTWNFISNYMRDKGWIRNRSFAAQKKYLEKNPAIIPEVFSSCPSYVYFKLSKHPPVGSRGVSLTDHRSIATDNDFYSNNGILTFIKARRPQRKNTNKWRAFSRFLLDQDTGGKILGKARGDIYFGFGPYAQFAANAFKSRGELYFLLSNH